MKKRVVALGAGAAVVAGGYFAWAAIERFDDRRAAAAHWQTIESYCADCHNAAELAGGLSFAGLRGDAIAARPDVWEHVVRKLEAGLMPPPDQPRPDAERVEEMIAYLTGTLDAAAQIQPHPGAPVLHRLNRVEYANAVRDLLDLPVDATSLLPGDDSSAGFDNISSALSVSPALLQAYTAAAAKISRLAIGDPTTSSGITTYTVPRDVSQDGHVEGLPLGTRGGLLVEHVFPLDAEYEIVVRRAGSGFGLPAVGAAEPVEISLNGERLEVLDRETGSARVKIPAGPQKLGVAMIAASRPRGVDDLFDEWAITAGVQSISIMGPFAATGVSDTPSRERIFVCKPTSDGADQSCARRILTTLASRAYRRPVDDASLATLLGFYEQGRQLRGFETGIQYALARVLVDPQFIYRFENEPGESPDGAVYELDDFEIASRLSFFLWSSIPDDELLAAASAGALTTARGRAAQVERMLRDPKAAALGANFASQWFGLRQLGAAQPSTNEFDGNLRRSFQRETELLFDSIVREDRSIVDLLDADYTFVDERLARHYGIEHVRGSRFRRVEIADDARRGILGHGSVLTVTSAPNRTSPVIRGAWVLRNLLGAPPPSPPPGVETNLEQSAAAGTQDLPLRARLERHRADPSCASCHSLIDPLGFALENFDMIGAWRTLDHGEPIAAAAELWDGTPIDGPIDLRAALLERKQLFVTHAVEMLMTYALGRALEPTDMPAVRRVVREAAAGDFRFSALALGVADSVPFTMKMKAPLPGAAGGGS
jgi:mono/diheme cytochrome c family protein